MKLEERWEVIYNQINGKTPQKICKTSCNPGAAVL